jgi:Zn-dependent peptidase ImmA (M78 family)
MVMSGSMGFKPVREGAQRHRFAREFAAEFLMPEESVRFAVSQLGIGPGDWTLDMIVWLKSKFNVSAESFALRLEALKLISERLRQNIREELRAYYKAHPKAMEPEPRIKSLKTGIRERLLKAMMDNLKKKNKK